MFDVRTTTTESHNVHLHWEDTAVLANTDNRLTSQNLETEILIKTNNRGGSGRLTLVRPSGMVKLT